MTTTFVIETLQRELTAAKEDASRQASQATNDDVHRFLLGFSIGLERALQILQEVTGAKT
jgi:hypothetical protein